MGNKLFDCPLERFEIGIRESSTSLISDVILLAKVAQENGEIPESNVGV
jgi:hypothetical protein